MSEWAGYGRRRPVEGGIKARSRRGAIGESWWSERFLQAISSLGVGGRLARGRTYARAGQVIDLDIDAGAITARVQGSRERPYRVRIGTATLGKGQWSEVEQALADDAWYAATLLAGELPADIEDVFDRVGLSLFPAGRRDLAMDCSCPDWEEPCKHLAAVFYLSAEAFDSDPFTILAWRGRDRSTLLANVRARRGGPPAADQAEAPGVVPLTERLEGFFALSGRLPTLSPPRTAPDALLDQLPVSGITVRRQELRDLLRPVYRALGD